MRIHCYKTVRGLLTVTYLSLVLTGCSNQFVYDRIDQLAQFYIERYVDLNGAQSSLLKVNLETIKKWHRQDELAGYLEFLDKVELDTRGKITAASVAEWAVQLRWSYVQIRDKVLPALVAVAETLTAGQIEEFAANMEKRNKEQERELLSRDETEYRESVGEEMEGRLVVWLGRLTPEQKRRLQQAVNEFERLDRQWLEHRRDWQQGIVRELDRTPGWQSRLTLLVESRTGYAQQADIAANDRNDQRIYSAIADVLNMRTDRQQQKLTQVLQQWRHDLTVLQNSGRQSL